MEMGDAQVSGGLRGVTEVYVCWDGDRGFLDCWMILCIGWMGVNERGEGAGVRHPLGRKSSRMRGWWVRAR